VSIYFVQRVVGHLLSGVLSVLAGCAKHSVRSKQKPPIAMFSHITVKDHSSRAEFVSAKCAEISVP
jgi:hypothetical protein